MTEILVRYIHILAIMVLFSTLVAEHLLLAPEIPRRTLRRVAALDGLYGGSALIILTAGLTLWFGVGKPAAYYNANWIFHLKVGLFVLVGLVSIYPTVFFMRARKRRDEIVAIPKALIRVIRLELALVALLPLLAILMARGYGAVG